MFKRPPKAGSLVLSAAKVVTANLMIADENFNIIYMNDSTVALLRNAEAELKKDLPHFDVNKLIGTNIDVFERIQIVNAG